MAADQLELFAIPNPCVGICESNSRGYCKGCLRSRDERFNWHQKSVQEQRLIIDRLGKRRARIAQQKRQSTAPEPASQPSLPASLPGFDDNNRSR